MLSTATLAAVTAAVLVACSAGVESPEQQDSRERKAAAVQVFRLHMTKDLWTRTNIGAPRDVSDEGVKKVDKPLRLDEQPGGLVTVELTGPQLVDYLKALDYNAHGGYNPKDEALAGSVYDAIAPVLDKLQATPVPGEPAPEVTLDAGLAPGAAAPTPTP
ncbi:hypothetical protein [Nocardia wallacei]|uniref:hypothetical protein n=1 Tax=Nocardia wallacei TaxID=480035 RepID=UPI002456877A|nr:hypothetical protein [Nocardia wallacei]